VFGTSSAQTEAINDVSVFVRNFYTNRNPLFTRLPHRPAGNPVFTVYDHGYRKGSTTLTATITTNSVTTLTLADASFLMNHDLLEIVDPVNGTEVVQVNGDPTNSTTLTVTRAMGGTSALTTGANGTTVYVIGNARDGTEINQKGLSTLGVPHTSYCQVFQFPVEVGGSAQATTATVFPGGVTSPVDMNKMMQLRNCIDAVENSLYYGRAEAPTSTVTAKMQGLRNWLSTNKVTAPANASAYTAIDITRDLISSAQAAGGQPDVMFVSSDFMTGLVTWGQGLVRLNAGATELGVSINMFYAPWLPGINIIPSPLLRSKTAFALTSEEVSIKVLRNPYWQQRGPLGDRIQGEWIAECALEVRNEQHHAWVEGISGFSAN
jgi:hypothetical protein